MRTVDEHRSAILAAIRPLDVVSVPLSQARGLVLADDVSSRVDLPGFDNSAMDGYAVRRADVLDAPAGPLTLDVVGELSAGDDPSMVTVGPGQAVRIMTGAPMPAGGDAVVIVEHTTASGAQVMVRDEGRAPRVAQHIRRRGEDIAAGSVVLQAGSRIDERRVGLLAATGHGQVAVYRRPVVAVVSTGSELVEPGQPLGPGQIHDSNSYMLEAALAADGCLTRRIQVRDDIEVFRSELDRLVAEVDAVVTIGGVSMGERDVVKLALRELGTVDFVPVAMQPGKPQGFGQLGERGVPFFGLPGNPVSAFVSYAVFVRPGLLALMGDAAAAQPPTHMRLPIGADLRSPAGRRQFARAVVQRDRDGSGELTAYPVAGQGSHMVGDLASANALIVVPEEVSEVVAGQEVVVWPLTDPARRVTA